MTDNNVVLAFAAIAVVCVVILIAQFVRHLINRRSLTRRRKNLSALTASLESSLNGLTETQIIETEQIIETLNNSGQQVLGLVVRVLSGITTERQRQQTDLLMQTAIRDIRETQDILVPPISDLLLDSVVNIVVNTLFLALGIIASIVFSKLSQ